MKGIFLILSLALAVSAMQMPAMPPNAADIVPEIDSKAEAMIADQEAEDPVLELLDDAMAHPEKYSTKEDKKEDTHNQAALNHMQEDQERVAKETILIKKTVAARKKREDEENNEEGKSAFAKLRSKFPSFANGDFDEKSTLTQTGMQEQSNDCGACIAEFDSRGGCAAWKTNSAKTQDLVPPGCMRCGEEAAAHCKSLDGHVKAEETHVAPLHTSPVPVGKPAQEANADLASGADASREEDQMVHKAVFDRLHPSRAQQIQSEKEKEKTMPTVPEHIVAAQGHLHHSLDTIDEVKKIAATPLVRLTLDEAKKACTDIRTAAVKKCGADQHDTHFYCITEGTKETDCDARKMKDAAACKVAHETAYNKCFSLWTRAKKNIENERKAAAAPMKHTDDQVKAMAAGSKQCSDLMVKANKECGTAFDSYKKECSSTMMQAIQAETFVQIGAEGVTAGAEAAAKESGEALKTAEDTLKKQDASPEMASAMEKCQLKKNVAKRSCIKSVHTARNACTQLTSTSRDDHDNK